MFIQNLRIILRGFLRAKNPFITNLIGLSTALAGVIFIYLWVVDELTFDRYHVNGESIFQVMENQLKDGAVKTSPQTADFLAEAVKEEMPEVEYSTVTTPPNFFPSFTLSAPDRNIKGVGKFADHDFFNIFSYALVAGEPGSVLANKTAIVLSESLARNLFDTPDKSIGKTINWKLMGLEKETIVSGVYKDLPGNSSEKFDFVVTFESFKELMGMESGDLNWDASAPFFTYIAVREGSDIVALNAKFEKLLLQKSKNNKDRKLFIKEYGDNYLYGHYENGKQAGGRIEYVILFSIIAVFILLIACVNFMNLSTAQALKRSKAVGIKRIVGAKRSSLVFQYFEETFIIVFLSFLMAVLIVNLVLPQFNVIAEKNLRLIFDLRTLATLSAIIFATTIIAGSYPAFYLSRFNPTEALKGKLSTSLGELWARKGLVVFQFSLSVIFVVFVLVVYKQVEYTQAKDPGYNRENVVFFEADGSISTNPDPILAEIKALPGVSDASGMIGGIIANAEGGGTPGTVNYNGKAVTMNGAQVSYGMIELLGMEMKEGRTFSRDHASDIGKVIFNEAAIEALGIDNPVGKVIDGREVLGVVKNFNFQSLHEPVKPYSFRIEPKMVTTIMVRIESGSSEQTVKSLETLYKKYSPDYVFDYSFLEDNYQQQYAAERKLSLLSQYATGLAILISCLGLFGLVMFKAEQRRKEIGIRKVLGSSEMGIVTLLSGEFMKLVILAVLLALPVSYFLVAGWLGSFEYKIELEWWFFAVAAVATVGVSGLTIMFQIIKSAKRDPAIELRSE